MFKYLFSIIKTVILDCIFNSNHLKLLTSNIGEHIKGNWADLGFFHGHGLDHGV